jgi:hypothetical protein
MRRGVASLAVVVGAMAIVVGLVLTGTVHEGSMRRHLEAATARRRVVAAADSALAEASLELQTRLGSIPVVEVQAERPEALRARFPGGALAVPVTARTFAPAGVEVPAVTVSVSDFTRQVQESDGATPLVRELAIAELTVPVKARGSGGEHRRTVRVRRFVSLEPDGGALQARVQLCDISREELP